MRTVIWRAIEARNIIRFQHAGSAGRTLLAEPHAFGLSEEGEECLELFQFYGAYGRWIHLPYRCITELRPIKHLYFEPRLDDDDYGQRDSLFHTLCQAG